MLKEYQKIYPPFTRNTETKKLTNIFISNSVAFLSKKTWEWTEKINGTNMRIFWDGHKLSLYGRANETQIEKEVLDYFLNTFIYGGLEDIIEQKFKTNEVMFIGEACGGKIQGKKEYGDTKLILFDVCINDRYLNRMDAAEIADELGLQFVPHVLTGTIEEAIAFVKTHPKSMLGDLEMEGIVGTPLIPLLDEYGERIITKVKVKDFAN